MIKFFILDLGIEYTGNCYTFVRKYYIFLWFEEPKMRCCYIGGIYTKNTILLQSTQHQISAKLAHNTPIIFFFIISLILKHNIAGNDVMWWKIKQNKRWTSVLNCMWINQTREYNFSMQAKITIICAFFMKL